MAGSGCPHCASRKTSPPLNQVHPGLAAEWHPRRNHGLLLEKITAGSHRVVWWQCTDCQGEFRARVFNRVRGTTRCPHCSQRVQYRDLATENPGLAAKWHPELNDALTPDQVTAGSNRIVWWVCPLGHAPWRAMVAMVFLGHQSCPGCSRHRPVSRQETDLFAELQHVLSGGEQQHLLRTATGRWRLDMLFPVDGDRQVVIEFDGSYWHRDSFDRDLRKALEIESLRPDWTVVRVREEPLELTRAGDMAVPLLADPFTATSLVLDHLMTLLPWPASVRARARSYTSGGQRRAQALADQLASALTRPAAAIRTARPRRMRRSRR
ncbi:zinc-ribbon domain-containing protein [Kitasatospora sp. NPDC001175]|uniref:zinc-ribbon domain-containing protein n=1 Tax=Kitasatospora sp. NPDC001175 TaxID=3157103 RepID=UPI003D05764A